MSGTNNFNQIQDTTKLTVNLGNLDSGDIDTPYNYIDWRKRAGIIKPTELFAAYTEYIRNWYNKRNVVRTVSTVDIAKQEYITLLKQLTLSFASFDEQRFLQQLDYTNDIDLAIAVPYFARQLKQIVIYLIEKRESVKATKLKYSMAGTIQAIEKVLYQHLLTAFTQKKYPTHVYDLDFYKSLPQLSSVNSFLNIQVEELYDDANYFDSDISLPVSAYTGANDFSFVDDVLTPGVVLNLDSTRNFGLTATDARVKYLGTTHYSVSADLDGNVTENVESIPSTPYIYITNRYFPTIATIPANNLVKTLSELGGFFTFKNLGVTTYLSTTKAYSYDVDTMVPGVVYNIPNPLLINHGRSLTKNEQTNIVIHEKNLDWVKERNASDYQNGFIINARQPQKYIPYQTRYEIVGTDTQGVARTTDRFDFWTGDYKDIWSDSITFPLNWRNEFDIDSRKISLQVTNKTLYNWTTDIFGNHYAIYKDYSGLGPISSVCNYDKHKQSGEIWVRSADNNVVTGYQALSSVVDKYATINTTIFNTLTANTFINIDVVQDVLVMEIDKFILIEHIDYDYTVSEINSGVGGGIIIPLSATNINYGGFWFNENESTITFCTLYQGTSGMWDYSYPVLYKYNLNTNTGVQIFPDPLIDLSIFIPDSQLLYPATNYERPIISYNKDLRMFNVSYLAYGSQNVLLMHDIDIVETSKTTSQLYSTPNLHLLATQS